MVYENVKTVEEAIKIIAEQDRMIGELTRKCNYLEDTNFKREMWLKDAKKDAGYDNYESFDKVWGETLAKSKLITQNK